MATRFPTFKYTLRDPQIKAGGCRLGTKRGEIRFAMAPGTDEAAANGMYVAHFAALRVPSAHYLKLYFSANNTLKLEYKDRAGSAQSQTWDCTGALAHDGTVYEVRIRYNKNYCKLYIDNVKKATINADIDFGTAPLMKFKLGTDIDGANAYTSTTFNEPSEKLYWYNSIKDAG